MTHLVVISAVLVHLALTVVQTGAVPQASHGLLLLSLVPLSLACLFRGGGFYPALAGFLGLYLVASLVVVRYCAAQVQDLLAAIEERKAMMARLNEANLRLAEVALTDELTGLLNRRGFDGAIRTEWRRARREGQCLGLMLIDLDRFKAFSDEMGHVAGDKALQRILQDRRSTAKLRRPGEVAARFGGDEIAVIIPATDPMNAVRQAERVRAAIETLDIRHPAAPGGRLTVSIGIATDVPGTESDPELLFARAEMALRQSKAAGRNCSSIDGEMPDFNEIDEE